MISAKWIIKEQSVITFVLILVRFLYANILALHITNYKWNICKYLLNFKVFNSEYLKALVDRYENVNIIQSFISIIKNYCVSFIARLSLSFSFFSDNWHFYYSKTYTTFIKLTILNEYNAIYWVPITEKICRNFSPYKIKSLYPLNKYSHFCFHYFIRYFLYLHFKCFPLSWFPLWKLPILSLLPLITNPLTSSFLSWIPLHWNIKPSQDLGPLLPLMTD